jgi:cytochrome c oxidase subunit II
MLQWLPEDVSPYGAGIDSLFYFIYYITAAAFIGVTALMLLFLYMYRHQEGRRAVYTHGNTALELLWTIIPAVIFVGLGFASKAQWDNIKNNIPETDTIVQVTGKQFNWEILYPGPDGEFNTEDDKQIDNDMRVPVGKPVRVVLKSKDVIHSLFLPNLRFKQDTVPGREIQAWFQADKPGKYEMPCAELCGFGHSGMKGWLYALNDADYQQWWNEQWPAAAANGGAEPKPSDAAAVAAEPDPAAEDTAATLTDEPEDTTAPATLEVIEETAPAVKEADTAAPATEEPPTDAENAASATEEVAPTEAPEPQASEPEAPALEDMAPAAEPATEAPAVEDPMPTEEPSASAEPTAETEDAAPAGASDGTNSETQS